MELCWILRSYVDQCGLALPALTSRLRVHFEDSCHCLELAHRYLIVLLRKNKEFRWILISKILATVVPPFKLASLGPQPLSNEVNFVSPIFPCSSHIPLYFASLDIPLPSWILVRYVARVGALKPWARLHQNLFQAHRLKDLRCGARTGGLPRGGLRRWWRWSAPPRPRGSSSTARGVATALL